MTKDPIRFRFSRQMVDLLKDPAPKAILLIGPPGAGKSSIARAIAARHPEFVHAEYDKEITRLGKPKGLSYEEAAKDNQIRMEATKAYSELIKKAVAANLSVILDRTHPTKVSRTGALNLTGSLKAIAIVVEVDEKNALERIRERRKKVSEGAYYGYFKNREKISSGEGYVLVEMIKN